MLAMQTTLSVESARSINRVVALEHAGHEKIYSRNAPVPDTSGHAPLTVWSTDVKVAAPVLEALAICYQLNSFEGQLDPTVETNNLVLLHLAPVTALCRAMAGNIAPLEALRIWQEQTRAILALHRRSRRSVRVLDIEDALAHPKAFRDQFSLPEGLDITVPLRNDQDDPFLLTLAQRLLHSDPRNRALMAELEAVSINLSGVGPTDPADPETVFRAYQSHREALEETETLRRLNRELQKELDGLKRRNDEFGAEAARRVEAHEVDQHVAKLLQDQNRELQDELEAEARRSIQLAERNKQLEKTEPILRLRIAEKENSLQAAGKMLQQLHAELRALNELVERLRARMSESRVQNAQKQESIVRLETELRHALEDMHHVQNSRSYRITRPLRRIRTLFTSSPPA